MKDLTFYPTDDLFDELANRFDTIVIVGKKKETKNEKSTVDSKFYAGDILKCFGLCKLVERYLLQEYYEDSQTIRAEDI